MLQHPTTDATSTSSRPFLKWVGGKQRLLHDLNARLPLGKRSIEPILGGGSVFLGTAYRQYLLGDANPDLMAVLSALQSRPRDYIERASRLFTSQNWSEDSCELLRDEYMPENRLFHLWYVGSLMPCFLHVSLTFAPSSSSLRRPTIWLSLNLDFFMWRLPLGEFSTSTWFRF